MVALVAAGVLLGLLMGVAAYTLTAFLWRRISWRYLRGSFLTLPLLALASAVQLDALASYLTDPIAAALGSHRQSGARSDAHRRGTVGAACLRCRRVRERVLRPDCAGFSVPVRRRSGSGFATLA